MKHFKTYEALFDSPDPPQSLLDSLRAIDPEYADVLLNWFEKMFKKSASTGEGDLERFYRKATQGYSHLKNNLIAHLANHFPLMKTWIELKKIPKSRLLAVTFPKMKSRIRKQMNEEYTEKGKLSWDPKNHTQQLNEVKFEDATFNKDWTWLSFEIGDENDFVKNIEDTISPRQEEFLEEENIHVLYNHKTLELYAAVVVEWDNIDHIYRNTYNIYINKIKNINQEIAKYIDDNMDDKFDAIEYKTNSHWNVNWKTFFPIFHKHDSRQPIVPYYRAYQAKAISKKKYHELLNKHFNNLIIKGNKFYTTVDDLPDFSQFFVENQQDFVNDLFEGSIDNTYSWRDFNWQIYWYLTHDNEKSKMIDDINQKFGTTFKLNDFDGLKNWLVNNTEASKQLNMAAANVQYFADETTATKAVITEIQNNLDHKWSQEHEAYLIEVSDWINKLMNSDPDEFNPEDHRNITEFIREWMDSNDEQLKVDIPHYGWQGEVDASNWMEELSMQWEFFID